MTATRFTHAETVMNTRNAGDACRITERFPSVISSGCMRAKGVKKLDRKDGEKNRMIITRKWTVISEY
jgi:hypothetical protein